MIRVLAVLALAVLSACASPQAPEVAGRALGVGQTLPPMKVFSAPRTNPPARANADIARDFLDLSFRLESGRTLPVMSRFEGPIGVRITGSRVPASLESDLRRLLARLRDEAGIDIALTQDPSADVTVEVISRRQLQRTVPHAACFVVPRVSSWAEYRAKRRTAVVDWTTLQTRDRVAVFIPAGTAPQEMRDCLHEEIAQGIGPLNDLYRLDDSVFNDDNFHTVLTGFDMLVLKAYYDPALRSGMRRDQVARILPGVLARLNPKGQRTARSGPPRPTPRPWITAVETALGPGTPPTQRRFAARDALRIAQAQGWNDNRQAFAHFAIGRLNMGRNNDVALENFRAADRIYAERPSTRLHRAHVGVHLAAYALTTSNADGALALTNMHLPAAQASENAALLATLLMIRAEALELKGRVSDAQTVRLDSLGWARYGFSSDSDVRARLREISSLSPMTFNGGG